MQASVRQTLFGWLFLISTIAGFVLGRDAVLPVRLSLVVVPAVCAIVGRPLFGRVALDYAGAIVCFVAGNFIEGMGPMLALLVIEIAYLSYLFISARKRGYPESVGLGIALIMAALVITTIDVFTKTLPT